MVPHTPKYLTSTLPSPGRVELGGETMRYSGVRLTSEPVPMCVIGEEEEMEEQVDTAYSKTLEL